MRILVTGSRDWDDWPTLAKALFDTQDNYHSEVVVVHGDCPTGADAMADWVAKNLMPHLEVLRVYPEPHPAQWRRADGSMNRGAGFARNAEMVKLGADVCLAFIGDCTSPRCDMPRPHPSHGATHTADLAEKAGIPVRRFTAEDAHD